MSLWSVYKWCLQFYLPFCNFTPSLMTVLQDCNLYILVVSHKHAVAFDGD